MSNHKTDVATAADSQLVRDRVASSVTDGEIRYLESTYIFKGTEAATGDNIEIGDAPLDAVVLPELSRVAHEADLGGSVLALPTLGDVVTANRYSATSISLHSSNAAIVAVTPVPANLVNRHKVTKATQRIVAAFTRTNAPTAGKKVKFLIAYRMP